MILLPLGFVLIIGIFKDLIENLKRYKSDQAENNLTCLVTNSEKTAFEVKHWKDVKVG